MTAIVDRLRAAGCVFAEDEARLLIAAAGSPDELESLVRSRIDGRPLEHLLGWAEFCGRRIAVGPGVFVPRRRTEFLAAEAIARTTPGSVVVDLCCGAGAIGSAITAAVPTAEVHAADHSPGAIRYARRNLPPDRVYEGDLYDPLPGRLRGRVDVVVANVPYVPTADIALMPAEARDHEPRTALDGGGDGLDVLRRVATGAPRWLAPGGHLLVEVGESQVQTASTVCTTAGLRAWTAYSEEYETTVLIGQSTQDRAVV